MRRRKSRSAPTKKDMFQLVALFHAFFLTWFLIVVGAGFLLTVAYFEPICKRHIPANERFIAFHDGNRSRPSSCAYSGNSGRNSMTLGEAGGVEASLVAWLARPILPVGGMWANFRLWKLIFEKINPQQKQPARRRGRKSAIWLAIDNQPYARNPGEAQLERALATISDQPDSFLICSSDEESLLVSGDDGPGLLVERTDQADQIYAAVPSRLDAPTATALLKRFAQRDPDWHTLTGWTEKA